MPNVVACTSNPATLKAEFRNGLGSIPFEGNSLSIGECIVWPPVIQHKESSLTKYWDLTESQQLTEIQSWAKLATVTRIKNTNIDKVT